MSELVLPPHLSRILWYTSWSNFIASLYGLYRGQTHMVPYSLGVWATSLLYWRHPTYGWQRTLDMIYCPIAIGQHLYKAWSTDMWLQYYILMAFGLSCYPLSRHYHWTRGDAYTGTILHSMIHIIPNIAGLLLYSTTIP